jgi:hypothetical protein
MDHTQVLVSISNQIFASKSPKLQRTLKVWDLWLPDIKEEVELKASSVQLGLKMQKV